MDEFCCRCGEDFPVDSDPVSWRMGLLQKLKDAPEAIRKQYRLTTEVGEDSYLCGNCYFDLRDE